MKRVINSASRCFMKSFPFLADEQQNKNSSRFLSGRSMMDFHQFFIKSELSRRTENFFPACAEIPMLRIKYMLSPIFSCWEEERSEVTRNIMQILFTKRFENCCTQFERRLERILRLQFCISNCEHFIA